MILGGGTQLGGSPASFAWISYVPAFNREFHEAEII